MPRSSSRSRRRPRRRSNTSRSATALDVLETWRPYDKAALGRRIRVIWQGSEYRGGPVGASGADAEQVVAIAPLDQVSRRFDGSYTGRSKGGETAEHAPDGIKRTIFNPDTVGWVGDYRINLRTSDHAAMIIFTRRIPTQQPVPPRAQPRTHARNARRRRPCSPLDRPLKGRGLAALRARHRRAEQPQIARRSQPDPVIAS